MAIVWRKQMSVGNVLIDNDHRYLLCLVNTVELGLRSRDNLDIMQLAIDQLVDYTQEHFAREERIQLKLQYPKYMEHKLEHQQIMERLTDVREQLLELAAQAARQGTGEGEAAEPGEEQEAEPASSGAETEETASGELGAASDEGVSVEEIDALVAEGEAAPGVTVDGAELVALLRHWIVDHVLKTDAEMRPFLKEYPDTFH